MTPTPLTAADWIYDVVLTGAYRRSTGADGDGKNDPGRGADAIRICPCRWGPCSYCAFEQHDRCTHHTHAPEDSPATHILARSGAVRSEVWPTGKPCAWRCSCGCVPPETLPVAVPEPVVEQLELFALAGGVR